MFCRYHTYCVGLDRVPSGRWHCIECSYCTSCGAKEPGGGKVVDAPLQSKAPAAAAQWTYEFKPAPGGAAAAGTSAALLGANAKIYSHTLCAPCSK